jgi:hypothetical protein
MRQIANVLMGGQPQPLQPWLAYALDTGDTVALGPYLQWETNPIVRKMGDFLVHTRLEPSSGKRRFRTARKRWWHFFLAFHADVKMATGAGKEQAVQEITRRFGACCRTVYEAVKTYGEALGPSRRSITAENS